MMKSTRRLQLHKQTLRALTLPNLARAGGGLSDPGEPSKDPGQPGTHATVYECPSWVQSHCRC